MNAYAAFNGIDKATVKAFIRFHNANQDVFREFLRFANEMREAGWKRYSARVIIERIRWEKNLNMPGEDFKINNNWTPLYARLAMHMFPQRFNGFFELRTARGVQSLAEAGDATL